MLSEDEWPLYGCDDCDSRGEFTLRSGTVMKGSHEPPETWALVVRIVSEDPRIKASQLQRLLGHVSYEKSRSLLVKVRTMMGKKRPGKRRKGRSTKATQARVTSELGTSEVASRLASRVEVDRVDDCWLFLGSRSSAGYGLLRGWQDTKLVHRIAYRLKYGHIPDGSMVLHHCDVRNCINPAHLYLGDHDRNMRDKSERWRPSVHKIRYRCWWPV